MRLQLQCEEHIIKNINKSPTPLSFAADVQHGNKQNPGRHAKQATSNILDYDTSMMISVTSIGKDEWKDESIVTKELSTSYSSNDAISMATSLMEISSKIERISV